VFGLNGPLTFGSHAHWVPLGVGLVSAAALIAAAAPLLRPLAHPHQPAPDKSSIRFLARFPHGLENRPKSVQ